MKITAVTSYPVWIGTRNQLVVVVDTDAGISGVGESGLSGRELAVMGAVDHYRDFLMGRDPATVGALWQEMYRSQYFEGGRVLSAAISAIDLALYDINAKALGVPVYRLLGGKQRDRIPCFGTVRGRESDEVAQAAKAYLDAGWQAVRVILAGLEGQGAAGRIFEPRESIAATVRHVEAVRGLVGPDPVVGVEFHHRLSVAEAASFCSRLAPGSLDFLEEPIRDESPEAYEALRRMTDVPFAVGEEFSSKWQFLPYIERGITNFARIDICNVGGFTEAMKVAGWAEAHYIDLMPHNPLGPVCTAATVHLSAACPNFAWMESFAYYDGGEPAELDDLFPVRPRVQGGAYDVPDCPGLGVEFNARAAADLPFRPWEAPHLRRRDGSYTNW